MAFDMAWAASMGAWLRAEGAWPTGASPKLAFWRGLGCIISLPSGILFFSSVGFGALARDSGLSAGQVFLLASIVYALPAQTVLVDNLARGASYAAAAFAVSLTAVRLLPMTIALMPLVNVRAMPMRPWLGFAFRVFLAHAVAITAWIEAQRRLPGVPEALRAPYFAGLGLAMMLSSLLGTCAGFVAKALFNPQVSAVLLFMSPLYFLISSLSAARSRIDALAVLFGVALLPLTHQASAGFDLLLAGLIGGPLAVIAGRKLRAAS